MSGGTTPSKPLSIVTPLRLFATFCVLAPTVAVIAVPTYNSATPKLGGFPFFYWYQLIWVLLTGALMVAAYWAIKIDEQRRKAQRAALAAENPGTTQSSGTTQNPGTTQSSSTTQDSGSAGNETTTTTTAEDDGETEA